MERIQNVAKCLLFGNSHIRAPVLETLKPLLNGALTPVPPPQIFSPPPNVQKQNAAIGTHIHKCNVGTPLQRSLLVAVPTRGSL